MRMMMCWNGANNANGAAKATQNTSRTSRVGCGTMPGPASTQSPSPRAGTTMDENGGRRQRGVRTAALS